MLPDGARIPLEAIRAVWLRRCFPPALPDDIDPILRPGCIAEAQASLDVLFDALSGARLLDPPRRISAAGNKGTQLRLAAALGVRIPRTIVTNDPDQVRRLFEDVSGRMVTKMLTALSHSMGKAPLFVHTSAVTETDLQDLDGLRYCPMVFQEQVDKDVELRVAYVGGRFFAGEIDASESTTGTVDWRLAGTAECGWRPSQLPEEDEQKLDALMKALGLRFGAIDLIRTPRGEHVFLEVNPVGEWGMLERDAGLPISDEIAKELLR